MTENHRSAQYEIVTDNSDSETKYVYDNSYDTFPSLPRSINISQDENMVDILSCTSSLTYSNGLQNAYICRNQTENTTLSISDTVPLKYLLHLLSIISPGILTFVNL